MASPGVATLTDIPSLVEEQPRLPSQGHDTVEPQGLLTSRSYQREMLEESMKRNIIVAAETGSGKTFIAILRIQAELERCASDKLVWFCVPTVALAVQQHKAITTQLPAFQARILSGADNVEYWTESIWQEVLKGIRIVVSTHQILLDALVHGFIRMGSLALMVFDEAHSCIGNHPSSRILRDFYHPCQLQARPAILGLSASPVINSKIDNLGKLESNLNAIARTPKLCREDMLQHIHLPELIKLIYPPNISALSTSPALESLNRMYEGLDIEQDPWIIEQKSQSHGQNSKALLKALASQKTHCHDQIKSLHTKAKAIYAELGSSATELYLQRCVERLESISSEGPTALDGLEDKEKVYVRKKLEEVVITNQDQNLVENFSSLSPKVESLISFLMTEESASFSGLIFVQTRAEVAVLSHLLALRVPFFEISTFVGASGFSGRKGDIGELTDLKNQKSTLDDLRYGRKNLIVTTNALEEGIDVSRCSVVICFDKPPNLKSFIQRRGRARKSNSKYVIMFEQDPKSELVAIWTELEAEMKRFYEDEMRQIEEMQTLEATEEGHTGNQVLSVESTGARITLDDAVQHLYHFCATLPAGPYVDRNPEFSFGEESPRGEEKSITATVVLPSSVDASVRSASGLYQWTTERMAKRDAAFEACQIFDPTFINLLIVHKAYKALYLAGLVTDNLLPVGHADEEVDEAYAAVEKRPNLVEASGLMDPWIGVAREWQKPIRLWGSTVQIKESSNVCAEMVLLLPREIPCIADFNLCWNEDTTFKTVVEANQCPLDAAFVAQAAQTTSLVLRSIHRGRMGNRDDFTYLFVPSHTSNLKAWAQAYSGVVKAGEVGVENIQEEVGLVRDLPHNGVPYFLRELRYVSAEEILADGPKIRDRYSDLRTGSAIGSKRPSITHYGSQKRARSETSIDGVDNDSNHGSGLRCLLDVSKVPKKFDFLHGSQARAQKEARTKTLLESHCEIDKLPARYALFAALIPSIMHKVRIAMIRDNLCEDILTPLQFQDRNLVTTAISASSALEGTDYQTLEFLGDSILKYMTSLTLTATHLVWHEGILSHKKDHIVSNSSLATAAMHKGLDRYILTKAFTGSKWRPLYNDTLLQSEPIGTREMSSKTLADVVESLIGAAFVDGGSDKALACLQILLPTMPWLSPAAACELLYEVYYIDAYSPTHLVQVEQLIAYHFTAKTLLLEALSHQSHRGPHSSASYERLEFLGDSILDSIITRIAFAHKPPIPVPRLHLIRTALVNGHFLGYLCLGLSIPLPRIDPVTEDPTDPENISTVEVSHPFYLWQAMRHASPHITTEQGYCLQRLKHLKGTIETLLLHGSHYPWTLLAQLEPPKPMSDIVESLLGAIYIDTKGSIAACEAFLERLGLMSYLHRVLINDNIALLHPKEELGQLANQDSVRYELGKEGEEGKRRLTCSVFVGERQVVSVGNGRSVMEVQTRAADAACKIMKSEDWGSWGADNGGGGGQDVQMEVPVEEVSRGGQEKEGFGQGTEKEEESASGSESERSEDGSDVYMTADDF